MQSIFIAERPELEAVPGRRTARMKNEGKRSRRLAAQRLGGRMRSSQPDRPGRPLVSDRAPDT